MSWALFFGGMVAGGVLGASVGLVLIVFAIGRSLKS